MSDIINAVKRLERVGKAGSKTNQKLIDAGCQVANFIVSCVLSGAPNISHRLPRDYAIDGNILVLHSTLNNYGVDGFVREYTEGIRYYAIHPADIHSYVTLAQDVASGLLDEIAKIMELQTSEVKSAISILDRECEYALSFLDDIDAEE